MQHLLSTFINDFASSSVLQFYYYPVTALERVFQNRTFAAAGLCVSQIEDELLPDRLDAESALEKHHAGIRVGHTVVVMASVVKRVVNKHVD